MKLRGALSVFRPLLLLLLTTESSVSCGGQRQGPIPSSSLNLAHRLRHPDEVRHFLCHPGESILPCGVVLHARSILPPSSSSKSSPISVANENHQIRVKSESCLLPFPVKGSAFGVEEKHAERSGEDNGERHLGRRIDASHGALFEGKGDNDADDPLGAWAEHALNTLRVQFLFSNSSATSLSPHKRDSHNPVSFFSASPVLASRGETGAETGIDGEPATERTAAAAPSSAGRADYVESFLAHLGFAFVRQCKRRLVLEHSQKIVSGSATTTTGENTLGVMAPALSDSSDAQEQDLAAAARSTMGRARKGLPGLFQSILNFGGGRGGPSYYPSCLPGLEHFGFLDDALLEGMAGAQAWAEARMDTRKMLMAGMITAKDGRKIVEAEEKKENAVKKENGNDSFRKRDSEEGKEEKDIPGAEGGGVSRRAAITAKMTARANGYGGVVGEFEKNHGFQHHHGALRDVLRFLRENEQELEVALTGMRKRQCRRGGGKLFGYECSNFVYGSTYFASWLELVASFPEVLEILQGGGRQRKERRRGKHTKGKRLDAEETGGGAAEGGRATAITGGAGDSGGGGAGRGKTKEHGEAEEGGVDGRRVSLEEEEPATAGPPPSVVVLGSGLGRDVFYFGLGFGVRTVGYELLESRHLAAEEAKRAAVPSAWKSLVLFRHGDAAASQEDIAGANLVYMTDLAFDDALMLRLMSLIRENGGPGILVVSNRGDVDWENNGFERLGTRKVRTAYEAAHKFFLYRSV